MFKIPQPMKAIGEEPSLVTDYNFTVNDTTLTMDNHGQKPQIPADYPQFQFHTLVDTDMAMINNQSRKRKRRNINRGYYESSLSQYRDLP